MTAAQKLRAAATRLRDTTNCNGYTLNSGSSELLTMVALLLRARPLLADWLDGAARDAEETTVDPQALAVACAVLDETEESAGEAVPGRVVDNTLKALDWLLSGKAQR